MALSSTAITVTITVKGYAAGDTPMTGFDKAGFIRNVTEYMHQHFPTRTPHAASVSNSENKYPNTNEVHSAVSAITNAPAGALGSQDKESQPAGDVTASQAEPITVTVSLA